MKAPAVELLRLNTLEQEVPLYKGWHLPHFTPFGGEMQIFTLAFMACEVSSVLRTEYASKSYQTKRYPLQK